VLNFTERAEEVFILREGTPEIDKRRALSQAVLAEPASPAVWWALLKHVQGVFGEQATTM
jgi:hypothetical protein